MVACHSPDRAQIQPSPAPSPRALARVLYSDADTGVGPDDYDRIVRKGLRLQGTGDWPQALITHAAGRSEDGGWIVSDVWESKEALDSYLANKRDPEIETTGELPEPTNVFEYEVYAHQPLNR